MRRLTLAVLCLAATLGCAKRPQCPDTQLACGTGCIPQDGVCCSQTTTAYCGNQSGGSCSANTAGSCAASFPAGASAEFCCSSSSSVGSSDCPAGQHHCGLACRAEAESCCSRTTDGCTAGAAGGGGGGTPSHGGNCLLQFAHPSCANSTAADCCDSASIGCDGMTVTPQGDFCLVTPLVGQPCFQGGNPDLPGCCNVHGGHSSVGQYSTRCPSLTGSVNDCSSDADCVLGDSCAFSSFYGKQVCGFSRATSCMTAADNPGNGYSCCDGLVVGLSGACGFPAGASCARGSECASGVCVPGATTATCQ